LHFTRLHPELFGSKILGVGLVNTSSGEMASHSPIRGISGRTFSRFAKPLMTVLNRVPELVERTRRTDSALRHAVTKRLAFGSDVPPAYVEFMEEMLGTTPMSVVADYFPAFGEVDERPAFPTLRRVETAVIGGIDDLITPIEHTDRIIQLLPRADAHRIPRCGHMGIIEHSEVYNSILDGLVRRSLRSAGSQGTEANGSRNAPRLAWASGEYHGRRSHAGRRNPG
jgi:pimeloyl-ACP methyl ester carboxylesterase